VDNPDAGKLKSGVERAGAIVGARLDKAQREDVRKLREAGADFVVLDADTAMADAALEEKIGFVLPVSLDAEDADLRLIGDLPLDALIVPGVDGRLTLRAALRLRRVAALARTPLLAEVDAGIDASSAQVLRESGVVGLIVDGASIGKLGKLRETIGALPPRGRRREEHHEATIPAGVTGGDEDEDDDWDDD
jgi:hypothetical protein